MRFCTTLELKSVDDAGFFEGYGSVFGNEDLVGDIMVKGAFIDSLREHKKQKTLPRMQWNHIEGEVIGDWLEMEEDNYGLLVKGKIWIGEGIANSQRAYRMLKGTGKKGLSIGYRTREKDKDKEGRRLLKRVDLEELSVVPDPVNTKATVLHVKGLALSRKSVHAALMDILNISDIQAESIVDHVAKEVTLSTDPSEELRSMSTQIRKTFLR